MPQQIALLYVNEANHPRGTCYCCTTSSPVVLFLEGGADAKAEILFRIGVKGPCSVLLSRRESASWVQQHIIKT